MKKLMIQAIRELPPAYVSDFTEIAMFGDHCVIAANPMFAPMIYQGVAWAHLKAVEAKDLRGGDGVVT